MAVLFPVASVLKTALLPSILGARVLVLIVCGHFLTDRRADPARAHSRLERVHSDHARVDAFRARVSTHPPYIETNLEGAGLG